MENTTRTLWGASLQAHSLFGQSFALVANTTINEKFGVQSGVSPATGDTPFIKGFVLGNKGHKYIVDATTQLGKNEPYQHQAVDASLFGFIPFVMRKVANDISAAERAKYAMRVKLTVNSQDYIAYYVKRVDATVVELTNQLKTISNGVTTTTSYVPTSSNLNPVPSDLNTGGANVTTAAMVGVFGILDLSLDASDITELMNVATILYGDPGYAIISEIGIITASDKIVSTTDSGGNSFNYLEVIVAQIHTYYSCYFDSKSNSTGIELKLNAGVSEPLYKIG